MNNEMFPVNCDFCNGLFYARAKNAKYCPKCAVKRKKSQDCASWRRRKDKKHAKTHAIKPEERERKALLVEAEKKLAVELNIPYDYLSRWKMEHKAQYMRWILDKVDSGELPDDIC